MCITKGYSVLAPTWRIAVHLRRHRRLIALLAVLSARALALGADGVLIPPSTSTPFTAASPPGVHDSVASGSGMSANTVIMVKNVHA